LCQTGRIASLESKEKYVYSSDLKQSGAIEFISYSGRGVVLKRKWVDGH